MGKIYCIMGKSSSGKDTLYKMLLEDTALSLKTIVSYTTRPMRAGEKDGVEYHFCKEEQLQQLERAGKVIEQRAYHTVLGVWKYFTVDDGQVKLQDNDYLVIGTLEAYIKIRNYYGNDKVIPIYVEVEDGERLFRAISRERKQKHPEYEEMCRRFLADAADFSEDKLKKADIKTRFINQDIQETEQEIKAFLLEGR